MFKLLFVCYNYDISISPNSIQLLKIYSSVSGFLSTSENEIIFRLLSRGRRTEQTCLKRSSAILDFVVKLDEDTYHKRV